MKKLVLAMIGVVALCVHSATLEETKRLVREYVDELDDHEKYKDFHQRLSSARYQQVLSDLNAIDRDIRLSAYLDMLAEKPGDPATMNRMMIWLVKIDVLDLASCGTPETLELARKMLQSDDTRLNPYDAGQYLMFKGDARDLGIIRGDEKILASFPEKKKDFDVFAGDFKETLAMRVAGTNVINYTPIPKLVDAFWINCIPSVTNTGPQGLYVQEILRQYWEKMEVEERVVKWSPHPRPFRDKAKIPPEIMTLVVWFDEDGNPVCNVDLAKHGLTMPEIDLPQNVKDEILRRTRLNAAAEPLPLSEDDAQRPEAAVVMGNPSDRLWIYAGVISVLCAGAVLWCLRKKR